MGGSLGKWNKLKPQKYETGQQPGGWITTGTTVKPFEIIAGIRACGTLWVWDWYTHTYITIQNQVLVQYAVYAATQNYEAMNGFNIYHNSELCETTVLQVLVQCTVYSAATMKLHCTYGWIEYITIQH